MSNINLRIVLLGNSSVGKTSLTGRYTNNKMEDNYMSTIGVDYFEKKITIANKNINLRIMDTCGQEKYKSISKQLVRNVDGIIFVFDLTNSQSFNDIDNWLTDANNIAKKKAILIGNKKDLVDSKSVNENQIENLEKKMNMKCFQTSAKTGENVEQAFKELINKILIEIKDENNKPNNLILESNQQNVLLKKKKCCQ